MRVLFILVNVRPPVKNNLPTLIRQPTVNGIEELLDLLLFASLLPQRLQQRVLGGIYLLQGSHDVRADHV